MEEAESPCLVMDPICSVLMYNLDKNAELFVFQDLDRIEIIYIMKRKKVGFQI